MLGLLVFSAGTASAEAAQAPTGMVTVVHAVEGFRADLYLDGSPEPALSGFEYQRVTDPLVLPAGTHRVDLRAAGAPSSSTPELAGNFEVKAEEMISVVAQLDPAGQIALAVFPEEQPQLPAGQSLLNVRHVAAGRPVDVVVDGAVLFDDVANVKGSGAVRGRPVPAGARTVRVTSADGGTDLVPEQRITLRGGRSEVVYVIGREEDRVLGLLAQTTGTGVPGVPAAAAVPRGVPGGDSGLADPSSTDSTGGTGGGRSTWAAGAAALVTAAVVRVRNGRRRTHSGRTT